MTVCTEGVFYGIDFLTMNTILNYFTSFGINLGHCADVLWLRAAQLKVKATVLKVRATVLKVRATVLKVRATVLRFI